MDRTRRRFYGFQTFLNTFQMENKIYPRVLAIAGSDPSGGAGIQADIKAISATGSYAASAITAVTVQNTTGVFGVHNIPDDIVAAQIKAVLDDVGADAIKIGMLSTSTLVWTVANTLFKAGALGNVVLDPVMVSTSGHTLLDEDAREVLSGVLAPLARVITPNIPEAEILLGESIGSEDDLPLAARSLSEKLTIGDRKVSVLMKAGHLHGEVVRDYLYNAEEDRLVALESPRIESRNTHGTGCTLSSALASYLAQGLSLDDAAAAAKEYMKGAISSGAEYSLGRGHGPVDHFWKTRGC